VRRDVSQLSTLFSSSPLRWSCHRTAAEKKETIPVSLSRTGWIVDPSNGSSSPCDACAASEKSPSRLPRQSIPSDLSLFARVGRVVTRRDKLSSRIMRVPRKLPCGRAGALGTAILRRSWLTTGLCRTCCITRGFALAAVSPLSPPSLSLPSPLLFPILSPFLRFLPILSSSTRPCSEIFCSLLPHRLYSPLSPLPLTLRRTKARTTNPWIFLSLPRRIPRVTRICVRRVGVCVSTKGQRPTLTTRHGSTRIVRANTQESGLFWFPGRYPDPHFSPRCDSNLSLFLSLALSPVLLALFLTPLIACARVSSLRLYLPRDVSPCP